MNFSQNGDQKIQINPYYKNGDVFQRDDRFYEQQLNSRKSRTPNKFGQSSYRSHVHNQTREQEEARLLQQQNDRLKRQLEVATYGGQYGTGDTVMKKQHYLNSLSENQRIREQDQEISKLEETVRGNNEKLVKYQQAAKELQVRMNNIQAIDKQIYKNLKGASMRDKELLSRASTALARGDSREEVTRILEQIIS